MNHSRQRKVSSRWLRRLYDFYPFVLIAAIACDHRANTPSQETAPTNSPSATQEEWIYRARWIIGEDPDLVDTSMKASRFQVRVRRSRSGVLLVNLDSAPKGTAGRGATFTPADSIKVNGLTTAERFTQACKHTSEEWRPRIAVLSDTVLERSGRPRLAWLVDTVAVKIRPIAPDSILCFNAAPD